MKRPAKVLEQALDAENRRSSPARRLWTGGWEAETIAVLQQEMEARRLALASRQLRRTSFE